MKGCCGLTEAGEKCGYRAAAGFWNRNRCWIKFAVSIDYEQEHEHEHDLITGLRNVRLVMSYKINPYIAEQNHYRFHAAERHYIEQLEARGGLIRIDNVDVDAESLVQRHFRCDSRHCLRQTEKDGVKKYKGCCCTDLQVDVTATEMERLRELGQLALDKLQFSPREPLGEIARRMAEGNITEVTEIGEMAFIHLRSGRCPLGWITREGSLFCGINALCYKLELPLGYYKPEPCIMFPLHFVEYLPGKVFVTVVCDQSHEAVGAAAVVTKLRCLRKPQADAPPAIISLKYEITLTFGEEFYRKLAAAAIPYLERAGETEHARTLQAEAAAR